MARSILFIALIWQFIFSLTPAFALNAEDIIRLKNAGAGNDLILKIDQSKAIYRALVSVDEVIELKSSGFSDEFILKKIEQGGATAPEQDREDAADRALKRRITRNEMKLGLLKKQLNVSVDYLSRLIANPDVVKLVKSGKIASEDYGEIVKYLKQYARGEETNEYGDGGNINIDIKKKQD